MQYHQTTPSYRLDKCQKRQLTLAEPILVDLDELSADAAVFALAYLLAAALST